jgi:hypothetical protein
MKPRPSHDDHDTNHDDKATTTMTTATTTTSYDSYEIKAMKCEDQNLQARANNSRRRTVTDSTYRPSG